MGVCGCGKSSVGDKLSQMFNCDCIDADDFHSESNKAKMQLGNPLDDEDRRDWLISVRKAMKQKSLASDASFLIVACSALKESYRSLLTEGLEVKSRFIHLTGPKELIASRLVCRTDHFMNSSLLDSQFDTLEDPGVTALTITVNRPVGEICDLIQEEVVKPSFGICGMGVMGTSLARNLASKGVKLSLYNRVNIDTGEMDVAKRLVEKHECFRNPSCKAEAFDGDLEGFVSSLQKPRKILIMATAGKVVDTIIESLLPWVEQGDLIIDAGNSHYKDTQRRQDMLWNRKKMYLLGCGVSGGEEGALKGPAIMPGGQRQAYLLAKPYLEAMAARDRDGKPCCAYMGNGGSGHLVKTVHNGMEYAEMQLLGEVYCYLRTAHRLDNEAIASCLEGWQEDNPWTRSYLLEITIKILRKKSEGSEDGYLIDEILDKSGNKGTGNWTAVAACELGQPATLVCTSLFARYLSAFKDRREECAMAYAGIGISSNSKTSVLSRDILREAYVATKVLNHYQGLQLLEEATSSSAPSHFAGMTSLILSEICRVWSNGCILRSELLHKVRPLLEKVNRADILLRDLELQSLLSSRKTSLSSIVIDCIEHGVAAPCLSEALQFLTALTTGRSEASALIQAQRDFFGSHGYQRVGDPSGRLFHTIWEGD